MKKLIGLMAVLGLVSAVAFAQDNGAAPAGGEAGGAPAADAGATHSKHHGGKKGKGKHKHGKKKDADAAGAEGGTTQ